MVLLDIGGCLLLVSSCHKKLLFFLTWSSLFGILAKIAASAIVFRAFLFSFIVVGVGLLGETIVVLLRLVLTLFSAWVELVCGLLLCNNRDVVGFLNSLLVVCVASMCGLEPMVPLIGTSGLLLGVSLCIGGELTCCGSRYCFLRYAPWCCFGGVVLEASLMKLEVCWGVVGGHFL